MTVAVRGVPCATAAALLAMTSPIDSALAARVTYRMTGVVAELDRTGEFPMATFSVGDIVSGLLTVEQSTVDVSTDPLFGDYQNAVVAASIHIGASTWSWGAKPWTNFVRIQLSDPVYGGEFVDILTWQDPGTGPIYAVWGLQNVPDANRILSDSLDFPTSGFAISYIDLFDAVLGPDINHPTIRSMRMRAMPVSWQVVPLPAAATLLASALAGLLVLRKARIC